MKKSVRQKIRPVLLKHKSLYKFIKSSHHVYCDLTSSLHTLPDFLIIGAPRSGTSSMYEYLIKHPFIYSALVKEPNYFSNYYYKCESWYRSFFPLVSTKYIAENIKKEKFLTGEASTQYYWYPHAAKRAKLLLPNAKIIMLLRNPIDRSYSQYQMEFTHNNEKLSFEEAIQEENQRIEEEYNKMISDEFYFSPKYTMQAYLTKSIYADLIEKWFKYYPKKQFLFIKSEEFYSNTANTYKKVLNYLQVPDIELEKYEVFRPAKYSDMKESTRKKLSEFFKPHNERLYKLLDIDFHWD